MEFSPRTWSILRAVAFFGVVLVAVYAIFATELRTCDRVQYLRDQANGTNFLVYDTFKQVKEQNQAAIESGKLKGKALEQARQAVQRATQVVDTTVVTGPTNCKGAVFDPGYKAPAPEFIKNETPQVKAARAHAMEIIRKAKLNEPLYRNG